MLIKYNNNNNNISSSNNNDDNTNDNDNSNKKKSVFKVHTIFYDTFRKSKQRKQLGICNKHFLCNLLNNIIYASYLYRIIYLH